MRTIVDLPEDQVEALAKLSKRESASRAALIRKAVAEYLEKHVVDVGEAFGLWKDDPVDGLEYEARIRSEWS